MFAVDGFTEPVFAFPLEFEEATLGQPGFDRLRRRRRVGEDTGVSDRARVFVLNEVVLVVVGAVLLAEFVDDGSVLTDKITDELRCTSKLGADKDEPLAQVLEFFTF